MKFFFEFDYFRWLNSFYVINSAFAVQLRLEEERCEEAEARVRELEKQVAVSSFYFLFYWLRILVAFLILFLLHCFVLKKFEAAYENSLNF